TTTVPNRTGGSVYIVSTGAPLNSPSGLFVDSFDNVYFADTNQHVVREIPASGPNAGVVTIVAGTEGQNGDAGDGSAATSAHLASPFGVFVDGAGNIFISDTKNNVIRKVAKSNGFISTVVGTNTAGFNGDGIAATTAQINAPKGMAQGPANSLLFSDSGNNRVRSVAGLTTTPALSVNKANIAFGNQPVSIASTAQTVTVKNNGASTITLNTPTITGANAANFGFTNHCSATLTAGSTCTVDVVFTPSSLGAKNATLTISDTAPESSTVGLTGTGIAGAPGASVSPSTLPAFAVQAVGTTSATGQGVTVTNNGTATLNISSVSFTGTNAADFTIDNTPATHCGATLAVGPNCTITVKFAPAAVGARSASLSISDNAAGSPQLVAVSGTAAVPSVNLSGATVTFADQVQNTTSAAKTVTVTNNGTVALAITTIALGGTNAADFGVTDNCPKAPSTLAASANCTISATFAPSVIGARTATITITDNASPTTQ